MNRTARWYDWERLQCSIGSEIRLAFQLSSKEKQGRFMDRCLTFNNGPKAGIGDGLNAREMLHRSQCSGCDGFQLQLPFPLPTSPSLLLLTSTSLLFLFLLLFHPSYLSHPYRYYCYSFPGLRSSPPPASSKEMPSLPCVRPS